MYKKLCAYMNINIFAILKYDNQCRCSSDKPNKSFEYASV